MFFITINYFSNNEFDIRKMKNCMNKNDIFKLTKSKLSLKQINEEIL
jgi:hypothetical protein